MVLVSKRSNLVMLLSNQCVVFVLVQGKFFRIACLAMVQVLNINRQKKLLLYRKVWIRESTLECQRKVISL